MDFMDCGDRTKPAVLCMHGMLMNGESMRDSLAELEKTYRGIYPTMSGYCRGVPFISFADEAAQIETYVKANCGGRLRGFYGLSQGAALGLELMARREIEIDTAVLDGTYVARQGRLAALIAYHAVLFFRTRKQKMLGLIKRLLKASGAGEAQAAKKSEAFAKMVCWPKDDASFRRNCMENYTYGVRPELSGTKTHVILNCGSREPYALKSHRRLRAVLPACREHVREGLLHAAFFLEHGEENCRELSQMFEKHA